MDAFLDPDDEGVSEEDTAKILGVEVGTLRTWRTQGRGPRFRKPGRKVQYTLRFIKEYLAARTHNPSSAKARRAQRAAAS